MNLPKTSIRACMCVFLASPFLVSAQEHSLELSVSPVSEVSDAGASPIQLAAAIGIVRPEPEAEKKPEPPAQPADITPPPVAQQAEPTESDVEESEPKIVSRNKILIGVGVAALLGAVAGGGGGGGSSSTPQH